MRLMRWLLIISAALALPSGAWAAGVTVRGAPVATGYNAGSTAVIRATMSGESLSAAGYKVTALIRYAGSKKAVSINLQRERGSSDRYEGKWPVAPDAATGYYTVTLNVDQGPSHRTLATESAPGFFVYRKLLRITQVTLDKAFYAPGQRIRCEIGLENLSGHPLAGLRVEFSNENYPWISTFSGSANGAGNMHVNPSLGLVVLRKSVSIPAHGRITLPMEPAGMAEFLQGSQVAVMGAGGPARHDVVPPPEVDRYTIAVWDHARKNLLDMQFSTQIVVRQPGRVTPKPYSRNYTHPYNDEIDFTKYREFYPPGYLSPVIQVDHTRTLYSPGEPVMIEASIRRAGTPASVRIAIAGPNGEQIFAAPAELSEGRATAVWNAPADVALGIYHVLLTGADAAGRTVAVAHSEIAENALPASLMVFCPHEDDEHPWAGLMRAMVEAHRPVQVVFYTGGDVGECERYFDGHPCDPVRAREFGTVRMAESTEALAHIGVERNQINFLGLPDGGSGEIWFNHIHAPNPFLDIYLAVDHAPYAHMYEPNLPYARDSVIAAVKRLITTYHPAMIAVPHPDERHVDHRTANWFTILACQELLQAHDIDPHTMVVADRAYGSGGYKPAPYRYAPYVVYLSGEAAMLKQEMSWIYQSQDGNLAEGSKRTFEELPREGQHFRILDWQQHEGWNERAQ